MFMKATASKLLPKSLSELTSMSGENAREKLNAMGRLKTNKIQTMHEERRAVQDHPQQKVK